MASNLRALYPGTDSLVSRIDLYKAIASFIAIVSLSLDSVVLPILNECLILILHATLNYYASYTVRNGLR